MTIVRVECLVEHRCPVTGLRRTVGELFDLPADRVAERVRKGYVQVSAEQA